MKVWDCVGDLGVFACVCVCLCTIHHNYSFLLHNYLLSREFVYMKHTNSSYKTYCFLFDAK